LLGMAGPLKRALNVPILCTLQGEDLFLDGLQEPYRTQSLDLIRKHLQHVDLFLSVSQYYADFMPDYLGIPREKMYVVPLGINPHGFDLRDQARSGPFTVGFLARIAPEKGLHVLADAYRLLRQSGELPEARFEAAGYMAADCRSYLEKIQQSLTDAGLGGEFHYRGVLDRAEKIAFLQKLDVMSVPATYDEPKGVSLLEAMACGGLLVQPDDPQSLADGILKIVREKQLAEELSANGFRGVREHYSAANMADRVLEAYESVICPTPSIPVMI